jgi:hypothetical protein
MEGKGWGGRDEKVYRGDAREARDAREAKVSKGARDAREAEEVIGLR